MRKFLLLTSFALLAGIAGAQTRPGDAQASASAYLQAWSYKDYSAMRALTSPRATSAMQPSQFNAAAGALAAPPPNARIVQRSDQADGTHFYFESGTGEKAVRGSIIVGRDGIVHPELDAAMRRAEPAPAGTGGGITGGLRAAADKELDQVLQRMQQAAAAITAMRATVAVNGTFMGQTVNQTGSLVYKSPGRLRMEMRDFLVNSNGSQTILYLRDANTYMDLGGMGSLDIAPGIGDSVANMKNNYDAQLAGEQTVSGRACIVLNLKPPTTGLGSILGGSAMKLFVDKQTWMPVRAETGGFTLQYTNVQLNPPDVTDAQFAFTPPANATSISLGSVLSGM